MIVERVKTGMRRARLECRHIGRRPLDLDRAAIQRDRVRGMSLGQLAKTDAVGRTTIRRVFAAVPEGAAQPASEVQQNRRPSTAA
jgi:DNA invertase Pin-like site-specific DNA recombinase